MNIPKCIGTFYQITPNAQAENCCDDCKLVLECSQISKRFMSIKKERDEMKELLSECAYSKHTQEAMSKDLFDRICKVLEKDAER